MSVDAQRLQDLTSYLHAIWYSFLQIGLAIFFLWKYLGPSCMGGVSIIIIMIPVSKNVAAYQGKIQVLSCISMSVVAWVVKHWVI